MRRFVYTDGSSRKFWEISVSGNNLTVRFGRIGAKGQEKTKTFGSPALAATEQDKLIAEKRNKGYREVIPEGVFPAIQMIDIIAEVEKCEPLKRVAPQLNALKRMSIRITAARPKRITPGMSRLGGGPHLPPGVEWPTGRIADQDIVLPFVAQLNLADLRPYDVDGLLPESGMLYFFYNGIDYGRDFLSPENWRVLYHEGPDDNLASRFPPTPVPLHVQFNACELKFANEVTLPNIETCQIGGPGNADAKVELTGEEWDAYAGLRYELRANQKIHQMLGHADDLQPFALENGYENARDKFFPGSRPFKELPQKEQYEELFQGRLLLQIQEEPCNKMRFGRDGALYFFIREQDLKARDFSKVWVWEQ